MKRVLAFLGILLVALFVWYFFIKQHDYQVRFQSETTPGTASQIIKTWNDTQEGGRILGWDGLEKVTQRLVYGKVGTDINHKAPPTVKKPKGNRDIEN